MRCLVYDALSGRVAFADAAFPRPGTRRALVVDLPAAVTPGGGLVQALRQAIARLAHGQLRATLADVFEPRRPSLDREVERSTHVQLGVVRRGQQSRRSIGG